ncbi:hypothetical protein E2562_012020 [Oryza meyeriana var. granulata]|uniref:Uncharacterized protein n=1 Tax=Oryza meyeriana var. granulata TaxID=110450 RepID=A0A6G1D2E4_9ORYZ|nr:hypothetical protein E2562_012020 [Oryza meyeriana var. granulata]
MRSVKILALDVANLSLGMVIDFMRCFPCVEKLYIKTSDTGDNNVWRRKSLDPVVCPVLHLRKLVLTGYRGNKSHVDFAMFFVLNGRVLETMTFEYQIRPADRNKNWIEKQKIRVKLDKRRSE